jgi:GNAT superfamily N-acetyltransferase
MDFRPATPQDCPDIARIQVDSYLTAYAPILPAAYLEHFTYMEQEQDWRDWFASNTEDVLFVAVDEQGELLGYALGKRNPGEVPPYEAELVALHIRQAFQRQDVGRKLVSAVSQALMAQGCCSLFVWVLDRNPARAFYEKLGGVLVTEKPWENNRDFGVEISEVAYGWQDIRSLSNF